MQTFIIFLLVVGLFSCSEMTETDYIADISQLKQKGLIEESVIESKIAIGKYPDSYTLRDILADSYSQIGEAASAAKEYSKALELGTGLQKQTAIEKLLPLLFILEQNEEALKVSYDYNSDVVAFYRGIASYRVGDLAEAQLSFLKIAEKNQYYYTAQAYTEIMQGNFNEAQYQVNTALGIYSEFYEANMLNAELLIRDKQFIRAKNVLTKMHAKPLRSVLVDYLLASTLVEISDYAQAEPLVDSLLIKFPMGPQVLELKAKIEFQKKNYASAKDNAEKALNGIYSSDDVLYILGLSNYQLNYYERAIQALKSVSENSEFYQDSQTILFTIKLLLNTSFTVSSDPAEVIKQIEATYRLANQGDFSKLRALTQLDPNGLEENAKIKLLLLKSKTGDETSVDDLKALALANDSSQLAKLSYLDLLANNEQNEALIDTAIKFAKQSNDLLYINFVTNLYVLTGQASAIDNLFDSSLVVFPNHIVLLQNYLEYLRNNQRYEKLIPVIEKLKQLDPNNYVLLVTLAEMWNKGIDLQNAEKYLKAVYSQNPSNIVTTTLYASTQKGSPKEVINLLSPFASQKSNNEAFWYLLYSAYIKHNDANKALETAEMWTKQTSSFQSWQSYVAILDITKNYKEALQALVKMEELFGSSDFLSILKAHYYLSTNQVDRALAQWSSISSDNQNSLGGMSLRSRLELQGNNFQKALDTIQQIEQHADFNGHTVRDFGTKLAALLASKQKRKAIDEVEKMLAINSDAIKLKILLSDLYTDIEPQKALALLQGLPAAMRENKAVINNIAFLLLVTGQMDEAAEAALKLEAMDINDNATFLHTVGLIKCKSGLVSEGRNLISKAIELQSLPEYTNDLKNCK